MALTIEAYHGFSATERKKVKRDMLQKLLDEHLDTEGTVNSIRGIMREELDTKLDSVKKDLYAKIDTKFNFLKAENDKITQENTLIKKILREQQTCLERLQKEQNKNNLFVTGIPNSITTDILGTPETIVSADDVLHHVLNFVYPGIEVESYKVLKHFDPREGQERHSTKIVVHESELRSNIFKGCIKFKDLNSTHYLKKVFIKSDEPPLTQKENRRLSTKMKELRDEEDADNPVNRYYIKYRKLYKNNDVFDEFDINNQLFH